MNIEKKVWPEYFQNILDGTKTFELRLDNFSCSLDDVLILKEWNPKTNSYTGRVVEKKVTCVFKTKNQKFWPEEEVKKHGFQVIAFK